MRVRVRAKVSQFTSPGPSHSPLILLPSFFLCGESLFLNMMDTVGTHTHTAHTVSPTGTLTIELIECLIVWMDRGMKKMDRG